MEEKYIQELIETTSRSKSNSHRIDELENVIKEINSLAINVRELTIEIQHMRQDYQKSEKQHDEEVEKISNRLEAVESRPARRYEQVVTTIITCLVSTIAGFILGKIFM